MAIFPSAPTAVRNSDVEHEYRQDTDFYYLTGFEEPNAVAVLAPDHPEHKFVLFVQPKDRDKEVWTGWRVGPERAKEEYGADEAFTIDKLDEQMPKLAENADRMYYRFGIDPAFDQRVVGYGIISATSSARRQRPNVDHRSGRASARNEACKNAR